MIREDGSSTIERSVNVDGEVFCGDNEAGVFVRKKDGEVRIRIGDGAEFCIPEGKAWTLRDVLGRAMSP